MDRRQRLLVATDPTADPEFATRMGNGSLGDYMAAPHDDAEFLDMEMMIECLRQEFETREKILRQHLQLLEEKVADLSGQLAQNK
jgi:hypothetical protein